MALIIIADDDPMVGDIVRYTLEYVRKPFDPAELAVVVERMLNKAHASGAVAMRS